MLFTIPKNLEKIQMSNKEITATYSNVESLFLSLRVVL